jgi:hypothetical protein
MKYEHFSQPVIPIEIWLRRMARSFRLAISVMGTALGIGIIGYHAIGGLSWIDSILEASMILGGMGAVAAMNTDAVKLFASFYALFSSFVATGSMVIIIAPWLHRLLHRLHAAPPGDGKDDSNR